MHNLKKQRVAFSMIELVFVIVILGIVASISSSTIVEVYKSYIPQKASALASEKTELAAMQIANRLVNAVPWSLTTTLDDEITKVPLSKLDVTGGDKMVPLEWIGIDYDGFSATTSWSGYCDPNALTTTKIFIVTNSSNLGNADTIMKNLSNKQVYLSGTAQKPVIIFKSENNAFNNTGLEYSPTCMGITDTTNKSCAITATKAGDDKITMSAGPKLISEHYVLAWSAYAIVPENCKDNNNDGIDECDLELYYNYQPWEGEKYTDAGVSKTKLLNNVTVFKFTQYSDTIRFKLCVQQPIGIGDAITTCKEKVVIR